MKGSEKCMYKLIPALYNSHMRLASYNCSLINYNKLLSFHAGFILRNQHVISPTWHKIICRHRYVGEMH